MVVSQISEPRRHQFKRQSSKCQVVGTRRSAFPHPTCWGSIRLCLPLTRSTFTFGVHDADLHGASDCYADPHTNRNADKHCHRHGHSDRYGNAFADADIDAGRALSLSAADRAPIDQCVAE